MSTAGARLLRNTTLRLAPEVLTRLAGLAVVIALARTLGAEELGEYVFAVALAQLLWAVAGLGIDRLAMREIARDAAAARKLVWDISVLKVLAALSGTALCVIGVWLGGFNEQVQVLVALAGVRTAASLITLTAFSVVQGLERMELYARLIIPIRLSVVAAQLTVLALGGRAVAVLTAEVAVELVAVVYAYRVMRRRIEPFPFEIAPRSWPGLLRRTFPFGLQESLAQLVFRLGAILLALLATSAAVGAYAAGFRLLEAVLFLVYALAFAVLPMYSTLEIDGTPSLRDALNLSLRAGVLVAMPIAVALTLFAEPIVELLYGLPEYRDTVAVLPWIGFAIVALALGHLAGTLVLVRRSGRLTVVLTGAALALNVALNVVLIPVAGAEGAAAATLVTESFVAVVALFLARPVAGPPAVVPLLRGPLLGSAAMAAAVVPFADRPWIALPLGLMSYGIVVAWVERRDLRDLAALARQALAR